MNTRHQVLDLWEKLGAVAPYPDGVVAVPEMMNGRAFFPGGIGLIREPWSTDLPRWPMHGAFILGHDFDTVSGYRKSVSRGGESPRSPTWGTVSKVLTEANIDLSKCFFTNVYMGLRERGKNSGPFPGRNDQAYVDRCLDFLSHQFAAQLPSLVVVLGAPAFSLLAGQLDGLRDWRAATRFADIDRLGPVREGVSLGEGHKATVVSLVHPSYRRRNVGTRCYAGACGHEAELSMLRTAARASGLVQA